MARGWESKAVESQIESAEQEGEASKQPNLSVADLQKKKQRELLELSRTRVLRDLESARNTRYRQMMESALRHLDDQIAALEAEPAALAAAS
jgi:hypothetical protein